DREIAQEVLGRGLLPVEAPAGDARRYADHLDGPRAGYEGRDIGTADEAQARVIEVVAVEVVDNRGEGAGADEWVEQLVVEEDVHRTHRLVAVVLADDAIAGLGVVRLADAREEQQVDVVELV